MAGTRFVSCAEGLVASVASFFSRGEENGVKIGNSADLIQDDTTHF